MKKSLLIIFLVFPLMMMCQSWKANPISVIVFNNATMLPPASLTATFNQPIHPGITVAYEFGWKDTLKHKWFQNAGISYIYHHFVYQGILLNTQGGYRWKINDFSIEGYLQAGYMHAFYLTDRCIMDPDGTYSAKQGAGKPQFVVGAGIGFGYDLGKDDHIRRLILGYDVRLQMPFVRNYVSLLPNGALFIGFQFNLE
ncbi:MAG: hypothetical protein ABFS05_03945 [Bacteroidota bacterium]